MQHLTQHTLNIKDFNSQGAFLKAARKQKGLSQRQAALRAGMSPSALCKLESDQRMFTRNLLELTDVLGVNAREVKKIIPQKKVLSSIEIMKKSFPETWKTIIKDCIQEIF